MTSTKVVRSFSFTLAGAVLPLALAGSGGCASKAPAGTVSNATQVQVDQAEIVTGVDDSGRDPAVVALDIGTSALCTGTLIAPDVILTARHCVSVTAESIVCPATLPQIVGPRPPSSIRVLLGDDVRTATEVARGVAVVEPSGDALCDADIALVVLDQSIDVEPLAVSGSGVVPGDHVTAIGYGRRTDGDPPGTKLLREHVEVLSGSGAEFVVGEATCQGDSGGPALDEVTGEIVGVVSRGGPSCDGNGAHNVYTRPEGFRPLIERALALSAWESAGAAADGGGLDDGGEAADAGKKKRHPRGDGGTSKPPSDLGKTCSAAADCSTGVCVNEGARAYCSRSCGAHDRCPAHYHCTATGPAQKVCLQAS